MSLLGVEQDQRKKYPSVLFQQLKTFVAF